MQVHETVEQPSNYARSVPANGLQNEGAVDSYRDDQETQSVHAIQYEDCWKLHLDAVNPRYDPVGHAIKDATLETALALTFIAMFAYKNYV